MPQIEARPKLARYNEELESTVRPTRELAGTVTQLRQEKERAEQASRAKSQFLTHEPDPHADERCAARTDLLGIDAPVGSAELLRRSSAPRAAGTRHLTCRRSRQVSSARALPFDPGEVLHDVADLFRRVRARKVC
jgi:hypothetical protein